MKVLDVNHQRGWMRAGGETEASHIKVQGAGVIVSLIQTDGGISITINPSGEPYMHNVKTAEVTVNSSQVRIVGAQGSAL